VGAGVGMSSGSRVSSSTSSCEVGSSRLEQHNSKILAKGFMTGKASRTFGVLCKI
jgi:hypothetical protein